MDFFGLGFSFDVVEAERKDTRWSLDGTETKLLASGSKPQIHEGFSWIHKEINWNPPKKEFDKILCLLIIFYFASDGYKTYKYWEKCLKP